MVEGMDIFILAGFLFQLLSFALHIFASNHADQTWVKKLSKDSRPIYALMFGVRANNQDFPLPFHILVS